MPIPLKERKLEEETITQLQDELEQRAKSLNDDTPSTFNHSDSAVETISQIHSIMQQRDEALERWNQLSEKYAILQHHLEDSAKYLQR
jgi:hypothetical protein